MTTAQMSSLTHSCSVIKLIAATVSLLISPLALALGLGGSIGNPVLMQSLRIEIPLLLSADEAPPKLDCVRISLPSDSTDNQFFPKNAKVTLELSTAPRLIITSPQTVREPFYEFRIALGCNGEISRDYLVLTRLAEPQDTHEPSAARAGNTAATLVTLASQPATTTSPVLLGSKTAPHTTPKTMAAQPATAAAPHTAVATPKPPRTLNVERTLTLKRDATLNLLARVRYPNNLETRDEYRRLMALANPALFVEATRVGSVPLPAGTVLSIPANLPPPERASSVTPSNLPTVPAGSSSPPPDKASKPIPTSNVARAASQDRLIIGGDAGDKSSRPLSVKEATATIQRLELMLLAQATEQSEVNEKLRSLESLFADTKTQLQFLEAKSKQQAADQRQLQAKFDSKPEPPAFGALELLALIVVSGAIGAALLAINHRQQIQRETNANASDASRSLTSLQPHAIFAATDNPQAEAADNEVLPFSKSVAPPARGFGNARRSDLGAAFAASSAAPNTALAKPRTRSSAATTKSVTTQRAPAPAASNSAGIAAAEAMPASAPITPAAIKRELAVDQGIAFTLPSSFGSSSAQAKDDSTGSSALPPIDFALDIASPPRTTHAVSSMMEVDLVRRIAASETPAPAHDALAQSGDVAFDLAPRTESEIEVAMAIEREIAAKPQTPVAEATASESAEDPAVELANIMISMGMDEHAEQTLIDYILEDPKRDLGPWLRTLEIYRKSGRRSEFEELAISLRKNLNVAPDAWDTEPVLTRPTLEGFSRVSDTVQKLWPSPETSSYLASLLGDNRDGSRAGFPQAVAEEILWLMRILKVHRELD